MEKEKPFACDVCGKRYKNLNGLKYVSLNVKRRSRSRETSADSRIQHKQHSVACDPNTKLQQANVMAAYATMVGMNVDPSAIGGLPNIGEDTIM
jgi:transcription factor SFP1